MFLLLSQEQKVRGLTGGYFFILTQDSFIKSHRQLNSLLAKTPQQ